jgi:hypothetical protein
MPFVSHIHHPDQVDMSADASGKVRQQRVKQPATSDQIALHALVTSSEDRRSAGDTVRDLPLEHGAEMASTRLVWSLVMPHPAVHRFYAESKSAGSWRLQRSDGGRLASEGHSSGNDFLQVLWEGDGGCFQPLQRPTKGVSHHRVPENPVAAFVRCAAECVGEVTGGRYVLGQHLACTVVERHCTAHDPAPIAERLTLS